MGRMARGVWYRVHAWHARNAYLGVQRQPVDASCCRVGANVTCTERPRELKDLHTSLQLQLATSTPSSCQRGSIEALELEWGQEAFARSPLAREGTPPFDAIILAEVVYNTNVHEALLWTIQRFSHPDIVGPSAANIIWENPPALLIGSC